MTTTPSAEELRELADRLEWYGHDLSREFKPKTETQIKCLPGHTDEETYELFAAKALRELAEIKEAAQQRDSAYAQAIAELKAAPERCYAGRTTTPNSLLDWIERRAAEITAKDMEVWK